MNYRQIEAFHAVMITESMTLAGKMLFISQPAVSRLIIELEEEIGFKLFEALALPITMLIDQVEMLIGRFELLIASFSCGH